MNPEDVVGTIREDFKTICVVKISDWAFAFKLISDTTVEAVFWVWHDSGIMIYLVNKQNAVRFLDCPDLNWTIMKILLLT